MGMHFIEQAVSLGGRSEIPNAFRTHINILNTYIKVNEQFFAQVKEAVEITVKLDGDRSIPWEMEKTSAPTEVPKEISHPNCNIDVSKVESL